MAFPSLSKITTSRNYDYHYVHVKPAKEGGEYLLFLHGFPSSSYDWRHQIQYFSQKGYGIVAPDLLGFGESAKPLDVQAYKGKDMAADIMEILDHEKISSVIGIGHDWGSFILGRLANYYPTRFSKYAFLDVGYSPPGHSLTVPVLQQMNAAIQGALGFAIFGFFLFFNESDAPQLMDKNVESTTSLFYSTDPDTGKKYLGAEGGFRTWLTEGKTADWPAYLTTEDIAHLKKTFSRKNGGFGAAINWYRAQLQNINDADEKEIPAADHKLTHPTLLITGSKNFVSAAAQFAEQMRPFVEPGVSFKDVVVDSGHWVQVEKPGEVNEVLGSFINDSGT